MRWKEKRGEARFSDRVSEKGRNPVAETEKEATMPSYVTVKVMVGDPTEAELLRTGAERLGFTVFQKAQVVVDSVGGEVGEGMQCLTIMGHKSTPVCAEGQLRQLLRGFYERGLIL